MLEAPRSLSPELRLELREDMHRVYVIATAGGTDDRTLAIVGTSFLESILTEVIAVRLPVCDEQVRETLFSSNNNAPLSTFASKVHMARAMNVVDGAAYNDLKLIGRVRNAFAHNVRVESFDHPLADRLVRKLKKQEQILAFLEGQPSEIQRTMYALNERTYEQTGRGKFACSISSLASGLYNVAITDAGFGAACLL